MGKLTRYLRGYGREAVIGPLFKLLEACFEIAVPLIMAAIIDTGIQNRDIGYILRMGGVLLLLGALGLCSSLTAQYFAAKAAYGFGAALRRDMFAHINRLSFTELDKLGTASLITRITGDVEQAQAGVNLVLRLFLRSPFIVVGALVMAFAVDRKTALIFAATAPLLALTIYGVMAAGAPIYRRVQDRLDTVSRITRENLNGIRVIRAFSRQEDEKARFAQANDQLRGLQLFAGKISALMNPLTYVLVNGAIGLIIWQGGWQVHRGVLTQGEVVALVNYMNQILLALIALAQLVMTFTRATASAARINQVLEEPPSMEEGGQSLPASPPGAPRVELRGVDFSYQGSASAALEGISFTANPGETIGIIGGTGAGKSTLVNLIPRFYDATRGAVLVDGVDVRDYPFARLRAKMGIVPQRATLFRGTLRENLCWRKPDATDQELMEALKLAQAQEIVAGKGGLDAWVEQEGRNFSGGQRQRLTIARALVGKPEILILDDSASALDLATELRLRRALAGLPGETTVFLVSQRVSSIRNADKILVLEDGALAGMGTHESLWETCQVYREICTSQNCTQEVNRT